MGLLSMLVPPGERAQVAAAAARLRPVVPSRRLSLVVAAIAPDLPADRQELLARYAHWSVALDDIVDGPAPAAVEPPADSPPPGLAGFVAELAGHDRSGTLVARFAAAVREAVAAGVALARLARSVAAGERPPPTVEEYLPVATESVNYRSFGYALLAVTTGAASPAGVDRALRHAAGAVRLANDLRSADRDRSAGVLNVLSLRTRAGAPVTRRYVRAGIRSRVLAHRRALAGTAPAAVPAALGRCLRLSLRLYQVADLRT